MPLNSKNISAYLLCYNLLVTVVQVVHIMAEKQYWCQGTTKQRLEWRKVKKSESGGPAICSLANWKYSTSLPLCEKTFPYSIHLFKNDQCTKWNTKYSLCCLDVFFMFLFFLFFLFQHLLYGLILLQRKIPQLNQLFLSLLFVLW